MDGKIAVSKQTKQLSLMLFMLDDKERASCVKKLSGDHQALVNQYLSELSEIFADKKPLDLLDAEDYLSLCIQKKEFSLDANRPLDEEEELLFAALVDDISREKAGLADIFIDGCELSEAALALVEEQLEKGAFV